MTQLILLTSHFPYYPGEQFLEQEIAHFSDHFDWVVVVPIDLSQSDGTRRDLPDGVELVEMVRPDDSRVRSLASRLTTSFAEGIARAGLPHKTALDLRFSTTALGMYDRVSAALDDAGVSRSEPTITYGYWLFKQAAALPPFSHGITLLAAPLPSAVLTAPMCIETGESWDTCRHVATFRETSITCTRSRSRGAVRFLRIPASMRQRWRWHA